MLKTFSRELKLTEKNKTMQQFWLICPLFHFKGTNFYITRCSNLISHFASSLSCQNSGSRRHRRNNYGAHTRAACACVSCSGSWLRVKVEWIRLRVKLTNHVNTREWWRHAIGCRADSCKLAVNQPITDCVTHTENVWIFFFLKDHKFWNTRADKMKSRQAV